MCALLALGLIGPLAAAPDLAPPHPQATPRGAVRAYIDACRAGRLDDAARVLDLRHIKSAKREKRGRVLATRLKVVLDRKLWIDYALIPRKTARKVVLLGSIELRGRKLPIHLVQLNKKWYFSSGTVRRIPALFRAYGPGPVERHLPEGLTGVRFWEMAAWQWLAIPVLFVFSGIISVLLYGVGTFLLKRITDRTSFAWDDRLFNETRKPTAYFLSVLLAWFLLTPLRLSVPAQRLMDAICQTLLIVAAVFFLMRFVGFLADTLKESLTSDEDDELRVRGVRTQVIVIRRVATVLLTVVGAALILIQFEVVRKVGVSLLASAGLAGIVVGLAAQKSIASILAGIQLAITQPMRIGDSVLVEGEFGRIEEINLTYVVVKIWDLRRLVVPISKFLDQSFENWTKISPELLGTVEIYADYSVPVEKVRQAFTEYVEKHPLWDREVASLSVNDATEQTVQLRGLVSGKDAGELGNLRLDVREYLIGFLQGLDGGRYLPRTRIEQDATQGN